MVKMSILGLEFKKTVNIKKAIDNYLAKIKDDPLYNDAKPESSYAAIKSFYVNFLAECKPEKYKNI